MERRRTANGTHCHCVTHTCITNGPFLGTMTPAKNAPKNAWMPMDSVTNADVIMIKNTRVTWVWLMGAWMDDSAWRRACSDEAHQPCHTPSTQNATHPRADTHTDAQTHTDTNKQTNANKQDSKGSKEGTLSQRGRGPSKHCSPT